MSTFTRLANLLFANEAVEVVDMPTAGDIVRDADGSLCAVERVGWVNGEVSPFYDDDILRAYVFGFCEDGSVWVEWYDLHTLSTEDVSEADKDRFCAFVKADLASMQRSFTVVRAACGCE